MYFMTWEMHGFPHQFPIAWENAAKSIKLGELGRLVPIFPLKYGYFSSIRFPSYGILYHMKNAWLFPSIAWENTAKSTLWAHRLFFHSIIVLTHSKIWWFLKRTNRKNQLGKLCFLKKKNQFQARWNLKQNISKEGEGMDVISSNIMHKYLSLHKSFLIFNNQLQKLHLLPKYFNEKGRNRGICQESVPGF